MSERSASQAALEAFEASLEYYRAGLQRCLPDQELRWREKLVAAQTVVEALRGYEAVNARYRTILEV